MSDGNKLEGNDPQAILLQSKDHAELLDVIDLLRSQGISNYVSLPQLIVCGDQSSGKSSVLEAVSGVSFPTKDNLCTRFATELVLRRAPQEDATVAITPGPDRTDAGKAKLREFEKSKVSMEEVPLLIDSAKKAMGLTDDTNAFSDDVLRVEISGPQQPHLTLVDLPGLIHAENKQQSAKDVKLVSSLVRSYMKYSRSIILAVVSAKNDYANQIVTQLARDVDPQGIRTLGIITKPDTLYVGSDSEKAFVDLARNKDVSFRLGWHVLRNRDYNNRDSSVVERDEAEKEFFSCGIWQSLPMNSVGIGALKPRLSAVLRDQIIHEFPKLICELEAGIEECRSRLDMLGDVRETVLDQRLYLMRISQTFSSLVKAAVDGLYAHEFFSDAITTAGSGKRLRATIQSLLLDFAEEMRREGHDQQIIEDSTKKTAQKRARVTGSGLPKQIAKSDYIVHVQQLMKENRGRELPGTFNPLIIGELFYEQSKPWKGLVDRNCETVLQITRNCLESILSHTTDESTRDGLLLHVIGPATLKYKEKLERKVAEIMRPHQVGHPITYNRYFTDTIQSARQEHTRNDQTKRLNDFFGLREKTGKALVENPKEFWTGQILDALTEQNEKDMDHYACSEATDCMKAYYNVCGEYSFYGSQRKLFILIFLL